MHDIQPMIHTIYAIILAFTVGTILGPICIPMLTRLKFGQNVRDEGPKSHLKKTGTPTMGGIIILISLVFSSVFFVKSYPKIGMILFVTLGFGIIGFIDDYIKVIKKRSLGLTATQKLMGQLIISGIFLYYLFNYLEPFIGSEIWIPFLQKTLDLKAIYFPFMIFVILGTVNGVNLTDGLDGLASNVTLIVAAFFGAVSLKIPEAGISPVAGAMIGALLSFLLYNSHPAKVFMGDTGSLALGGFVASTAIVLKMPLFLVLVGLIYVLEALSVIIQVTSFKLTGKRVFLMSPLHHHFELKGWKETKVVAVFSIVTAVLGFIGLLAV